MGHRKNGSRSLAHAQNRRGISMGIRVIPSTSSLQPLSHSSPIRQQNRPPFRAMWGGDGPTFTNYNGNINELKPCAPKETFIWGGNFNTHSSKSPNSLSIESDGGRSISSDGGSSKTSNGVKKPIARTSNPLRFKTELCRSYEENGDCRFGSTCTFAHGLRELRAVLRHPRYKTDLCRTYHGAGYCQYGARCHFVHDPEEAAGVTSMEGYRLRFSHDGVNQTVVAVADNCGTASRFNTNDLILSNLKRLQEYKLAEEKFGFFNSSGYCNDRLKSIGKFPPDLLSLNLLTIGQDNLSALTSASQPQSNAFKTSNPSVNYMDVKSPGSGDSKVGRSVLSLDGDWWDTKPDHTSLYAVHSSSSSRPDTWRLGEASSPTKPVIGNPMEVSHNLVTPSITELMHLP